MKKLLSTCLIALLLISLFSPPATADTSETISATGPGGRIFGLDISRYQHTKNQPINFSAMYGAGVRFLWINGGNTLSEPDVVATNYYVADRRGAQAVGIYTGFYYYAHLPNTTVKATIIANANNQASKIIKRIRAQGGYNSLDLPLALDLETNCTALTIFKICRHSMAKSNVTLWTKTWMHDIAAATGRQPFFYSYIGFINAHIAMDPYLSSYPLWISTAGINPSNPKNLPTLKSGHCPVSPWIDSHCTVNWQFWQYSGSGAGSHYGLQSGAVDLDVFQGSSLQFLDLVNGTIPTIGPAPSPQPTVPSPQSEN